MLGSGLMSIVDGARKSRVPDLEHVERGKLPPGQEKCIKVTTPARTLASILDEAGVEDIQFSHQYLFVPNSFFIIAKETSVAALFAPRRIF